MEAVESRSVEAGLGRVFWRLLLHDGIMPVWVMVIVLDYIVALDLRDGPYGERRRCSLLADLNYIYADALATCNTGFAGS